MQFLYQPLTWGFLLIAVPILIHLINMLRHRRRKWAAMDFLLESYRRNRRWVMLKQWLLLASRILAMILLVAMLAKWVSGSKWLSWIGGQTTHHYILLDDSYSMGAVEQNKTAYDRGLEAIGGVVRSIAAQPGQHQITLLRWSRANLALNSPEENARLDAAADLLAQSVPQDPARLLDRINATSPTSLHLAPESSLELITPLITENTEQQSEVYLVTDFRRNEFAEPEALKNQLQTLDQNESNIHVIDCAQDPGKNISIVSVEPEQEVWAAGVPLMVRFQIRNRTNQAAKNVIVQVKSITYPQGVVTPSVENSYSGDLLNLPPVVIDQISAGETVTRQVQMIFGVPGDHVVEASIADDILDIDNRRWCTIAIKQAQRVLLVDGELDQSNAFFLDKLINPDEKLSTGIEIDTADAAYLRDIAPESLDEFDVVALLDVPRLDAQAVEKLEAFCKDGGGLFFLCGRNTNLKFVNESLHREGEGAFPVPLETIEEMTPNLSMGEPQVTAAEHLILEPLLRLESSPFILLQIRKLLRVNPKSLLDHNCELVATGPAKHPLVIDRAFGQGRVVTVLTGLTADWSNWAQDPTFVVMALRTLGYLGSFRRPATEGEVGETIEMITSETVLPEAEILIPPSGEGSRLRLLQEVVQVESQAASLLRAEVSLEGSGRESIDSLLRPGVFEAWMTNAQGDRIVKNFARNVPAVEGDLDRVTASEFEKKLGNIPVKIRTAESLSGSGLNSQMGVHSTLLLCLLGLLLLGEQALAFSASYHTPGPVGVRR